MPSDIDETLAKRSPVYGPYGSQILVRRSIVNIMSQAHEDVNNRPPSERHLEYFWDIANKLSRISVSPDHLDSWHDIQGYAKLVEEDIIKLDAGV